MFPRAVHSLTHTHTHAHMCVETDVETCSRGLVDCERVSWWVECRGWRRRRCQCAQSVSQSVSQSVRMFVGGRPSRRERRERRSQTVGGSSVAVAGVGLRMLKDMGWQEGDELGRHGGSEDRRRRNGGGGGGGSGDHILSSRAGLGAVAASAGGRAACITLPSSSQVRRAKHSAGLGSAVAASAPSADKLWEQTNMGYKLMLQRVSMNCVRVERGEGTSCGDGTEWGR